MKYGINLSYDDLLDNNEALAIVAQYLPAFSSIKEQHPQMTRLSFSTLGKYMPQVFSEEILQQLDLALKEYGKDKGYTATEIAKMKKYQTMEADRKIRFAQKKKSPTSNRYTEFHPGEEWLDTNGEPIQAHAGQVYFENGIYYWYGENKEFTRGEEETDNDIWTWGIRCYRSTDLYNWEDLGLIVEPDLDHPDGNLFPDAYVDRPHIVKCKTTGKYVMWIKISGAEACFTILSADKITGPYKLEKEDVKPFQYDIGDFDLLVDPTTQKCYMTLDVSHQKVATLLLTEDYLAVDRELASQYENRFPPLNREGMTMTTHNGKKYLLTSGTTGYTPNQCDYAVGNTWESSLQPMGDPHVGDCSFSSFNSQPSQIFQVHNSDTYICIADRWMPDHLLTGDIALRFRNAIAHRYEPDSYPADDEALALYVARPDLERCNTSKSRYIWLPVSFENGRMQITWHDHWQY